MVPASPARGQGGDGQGPVKVTNLDATDEQKGLFVVGVGIGIGTKGDPDSDFDPDTDPDPD